jgi:hypothetical protein
MAVNNIRDPRVSRRLKELEDAIKNKGIVDTNPYGLRSEDTTTALERQSKEMAQKLDWYAVIVNPLESFKYSFIKPKLVVYRNFVWLAFVVANLIGVLTLGVAGMLRMYVSTVWGHSMFSPVWCLILGFIGCRLTIGSQWQKKFIPVREKNLIQWTYIGFLTSAYLYVVSCALNYFEGTQDLAIFTMLQYPIFLIFTTSVIVALLETKRFVIENSADRADHVNDEHHIGGIRLLNTASSALEITKRALFDANSFYSKKNLKEEDKRVFIRLENDLANKINSLASNQNLGDEEAITLAERAMSELNEKKEELMKPYHEKAELSRTSEIIQCDPLDRI